MPTANRINDVIRIDTDYPDRNLIGQLPGAAYDSRLKVWHAPLSWAACVALRGLFKERLEIGPDLMDWAWDERQTRIEEATKLRMLLEPNFKHVLLDRIEEGATLRLKPYQIVDTEFLLTNKRALLANPPGLGKTATVIRTIQLMRDSNLDPFPVVITCPNSLKFTVWASEFKKWAPEIKVQTVDGSATIRRKQLASGAQVFILNWEALRLHSRLAPYGRTELTQEQRTPKELNRLGHRTAVFDEAHKAKDPGAQQTRAAWAVAHQAEYRFALTGTPVSDHLGDLWSILHLIEPTWFPAKTKFLDRYADTTLNIFGGFEVMGIKAENRTELFSVVDPLNRRLPKAAALPQLPPKLPVQYRHTPMSPAQAKAYKQMESEMLAHLDQLLIAPNPLSQLTRLIQFASASATVLDDGEVRLTLPSSKVDDLIELLEEMGEEPLVVAAVSRQLIELASKRLTDLKIPHGLVTGAVSPREREVAVDRFQTGHNRVILMTLGAGAEGLTLTRADTMCFMQRSWSALQNQQAEDRIHRIGSEGHECITIIDMVTPGTIEERKLSALHEKEQRIEEIVRDQEVIKKLLGAA